ncbi:MAG: GNAT family N-acetyltransferase [Micrococcales bacterium 73-13]|nr:MAG: GNAT family N-acetyltransferase [Micrococcales bacterium 73-13]
MPEITTAPATADRWADVVAAMTGGGDGGSCWCRWFHSTSSEWRSETSEQRRAALEREVAAGPARGLVAYVDGAVAGWVRVAPRVEQGRLRRSRIPKASPAPMADPAVWAITCFQVRREHRGQGVVRRLVADAVEFAEANGAVSVEAYPIDTSVAATSDNDLYHGPASAFLANGFTEAARPAPARPVLVRDLSGAGPGER